MPQLSFVAHPTKKKIFKVECVWLYALLTVSRPTVTHLQYLTQHSMEMPVMALRAVNCVKTDCGASTVPNSALHGDADDLKLMAL